MVQALPKGDRGELAVELLTEIGVARIVPWAAARSVAVWRGDRAAKSLAKWQATAREAAKQARRAWFPEVSPLASTAEVAALIAGRAPRAGAPRGGDRAAAGPRCPTGSSWSSAPRAGWRPTSSRRSPPAGARTVRLGAEVLRTSTAGVAAASALLSRTPRWR